MRLLRPVYLVTTGAVLCWLAIAFVVVPRLGDALSFNKAPDTTSPDGAKADQAGNPVPPREFRGNVYHIIFDSYQSEAYQYFLEKTPELKQLPVTYFPNFHSNSALTHFSAAELFAGGFYTPGALPENWHNAAFQSGGMMGYLAGDGIRLHLYVAYPEYC